ncbi:MAG: IgGFc-binding protein [Nannocystaceae bacterium]
MLPFGCGAAPRDEGYGAAGSATAVTSAGGGDSTDGGAGGSTPGTDDAGDGSPGSGDSSAGGGAIFDLGSADDGGGEVPTTCDELDTTETTVGCTFFGVDLDQAQIFENQQYAIVVSNVQGAAAAEVVVEQKQAGAWVTVAGPIDVPALGLYTFELDNLVQIGSGIKVGGAYRVRSSVPIIAYQFNPLVMGWWSSDASLLYPLEAWDTLVDVVHGGQGSGKGYISIVAAVDGTQVQVRPSTNTTGAGGVPPGVAGGTFMLALDEGDVAQIAVAQENASLTGTRIESDQPVAVFTGHECAWIPHMVSACDHIEDQLSGVRLWGTHFAGSRIPVRETGGTPETSLWQIVASENGTTVNFAAHADVTGLPGAPVMLDAGEFVEYWVGGSFENPGDMMISADKPIAVANFMTGSGNLVTSTLGDPAIVQLSPVEQYLPRYIVLVPSEWELDMFVVTRPAGATIVLDGAAIDDTLFIPIAGGEYEVARLPTIDGFHTLESESGFMVEVVGFDSADSYAYLGGTGTGKINPNPEG